MNTVDIKSVTSPQYLAKDLIGDNMERHGHTAFVGECSNGPKHSLHLITYNGIVWAFDPYESWTGSVKVIVDHFCNVTIRED